MFTFILSTAAISSLVFGIYQYRHLFINSSGDFKGMADRVKGAMVGNGVCQATCYSKMDNWHWWSESGETNYCHSVTSDGDCKLACPNSEKIQVEHALWANGWYCEHRGKKVRKYKENADPDRSTEIMQDACNGKDQCHFVIKDNGELDPVGGGRTNNLGNPSEGCGKKLLVWYKCGGSNKCTSEEAASMTEESCGGYVRR